MVLLGMKEIVINSCFGGFGLSYKACMLYAKLCGFKLYSWVDDSSIKIYGSEEEARKKSSFLHYCTKPVKTESDYKKLKNDACYWVDYDIPRDDKNLVKVVKTLGKRANGNCANLSIVEIPDNVDWEVSEYDGNEHIAEKHETWC